MIEGTCDNRFHEVKNIFSHALKSGFETGAALAIEYNGETVVNLWGGFQDADQTKEWREDTLVNVFSVTKGITAICVSQLIDQGKLDPNQKVSFYWPEYGCNEKKDTKVCDFLCHRAGMHGFKGGMPKGSWQNWQNFVSHLEAQAPYSMPGTSQGYHALTYGWLVGELFRRVDGRTVGEYFKEEIAIPHDIDFHIGLQKEDFSRCADMLMLDFIQNIEQVKFLKFIPNLILPKKIKTLKAALLKGDFLEAFQRREEDGIDFPNSDDWRLAEIPSANGHGTAKSLAKLYGILSNSNFQKKNLIISRETLELAITPHSSGPDSVLFGADIKFGLGFELEGGIATAGSIFKNQHSKMFGHAGVGGAVAFGDLDSNLGYGFVCNQQHDLRKIYQTNNQITKELYSLIAGL